MLMYRVTCYGQERIPVHKKTTHTVTFLRNGREWTEKKHSTGVDWFDTEKEATDAYVGNVIKNIAFHKKQVATWEARLEAARNRFITGPSGEYFDKCQQLTEMGLMEDLGRVGLDTGMHCFAVTPAGKEAVESLRIAFENAQKNLESGRDYLMSTPPDEITVEDALETLGFGRNGLGA